MEEGSRARTALICGITGQDGSYLSRLLLEKGYRVVGASRDADVAVSVNLAALGLADRVEVRSVDLTDFGGVYALLDAVRPDEVYNLSGQSSVGLSFAQPVETMRSIVLTTLNLLEVLRFARSPARFYNAASSECFGDTTLDRPADEDTALRPRSPYGVAKSTALWQVANYREAYGLYACSGLLSNHESNLRPERFIVRKVVRTAVRIARGSRERLQVGDVEVVRDWGYAPEYVDAMWRILQQDSPRDYVIATGESASLRSLIEAVFAELRLDAYDHMDADPSLLRPSDIRASHLDPGRAARELGWTATTRAPRSGEPPGGRRAGGHGLTRASAQAPRPALAISAARRAIEPSGV